MAKTILTSKQLDFLECIQKDKTITERFYLTGGTALAEFYLHHRLSEDIDLFTEKEEVNQKVVEAFLIKNKSKLSIKNIKKSNFLGLFSYKLIYNDASELKVDFNYYPFPRIEKGELFKKLSVDGIYDIATNKVHTLFMKPRSRDYIDLYFILNYKNYSLDKLILDAKAKFDWHIDRITLSSQFLRVKEFADYPKILVPFNRKKMEDFFIKLAKDLEKDIFD